MRESPIETAREPKLTYDDYKLLPDDGKRYEIIDGDLYVTPSPTTRHQDIVLNLALILNDFVKGKQLGKVYVAPLDVILSEHTVVQPDLIFVSHEREHVVDDWIRGAPDLVIEVLSPTTRDRDLSLKRKVYFEHGVIEYWIVDPEEKSIQIWRGQTSETFSTGKATLTQSVLAGLELNLVEVFSPPEEDAKERDRS